MSEEMKLSDVVYELDAVIIEVEHHAFDEIELATLKRVRDTLAKLANAPAHADEPVAWRVVAPDGCTFTLDDERMAARYAGDTSKNPYVVTPLFAHPSAGIRSEVIGGEPMACPFCACEMMAGSPDYVTAKTEHGKECPLYTVHPMRCSWPSRQWNHRAERAELPTTLRIPAYPQRLDHDGIPDKNGAYILTDDYEKLRAYVRALGESS